MILAVTLRSHRITLQQRRQAALIQHVEQQCLKNVQLMFHLAAENVATEHAVNQGRTDCFAPQKLQNTMNRKYQKRSEKSIRHRKCYRFLNEFCIS